MQRRNFLQALALTAASGVISNCAQAQITLDNSTIKKPDSVAFFGPNRTIRGVNLGGWLLLEKWIAPAVFDGIKAPDEFRFSLDDGGTQRLREHRESFISEADFRWIAQCGLNAVRLPVGYWILEGDESYIAAPDILDRAFAWAKQYNLGILLDLHGAPGSQNGRDHSGRNGPLEWTTATNIAHTIDVLESFARRYGQHPNLIGLELLNEPSVHLPIPLIADFSTRAIERVRPHLAPDVAVVLHDAFRPYDWKEFAATAPPNTLLDAHLYQCYSEDDKNRDFKAHIEKAAIGRAQLLGEMQKQLPAIVGEWSLCLRGPGVDNNSDFAKDLGYRAYAAAQLLSYETTRGWFFWTYKTQSRPEWSLRDCVERGWMPASFAAK